MNSDFKEWFALLDKHKVRYLVVGGYAVMLYTDPRYTKDIDIAIGTSPEDILGTIDALAEFGFNLDENAKSEFYKPNSMIVIGRPPNRIDILNEVKGLQFDAAYDRRTLVEVDGQMLAFISLADLITAKQASGRPQDILDLERLAGETEPS